MLTSIRGCLVLSTISAFYVYVYLTTPPCSRPKSSSVNMEVNREEALRCLSIAQKHRNGSNLPSALKFAKKSVSLFSTPEGEAMVTIIERDIIKSGSSGENESASASASASGTSTPRAKASGVEEHVTSAHQRPGHKTTPASSNAEASGSGAGSKKREYTTKQIEVVKRVKSCKHHEYYQILSGESSSACTVGLSLMVQWRRAVQRTMSRRPTRR